ncbi:MAG: hypothetical protein MJ222_03475 [Bacilli bacterium]|nr:hypothetical protein [Bacilli bacterium]
MNDKEIIKQLKEGSFYMVFEGSKDGHPGMIYWKNDQANLYLAVTTGSTEFNNPHFEKLPDPTSKKVSHSFVNKRPFLGKRKDFSKDEIPEMKFSLEDYEIVIKVMQREPRESINIKKKDRSIYRLLKKKKTG